MERVGFGGRSLNSSIIIKCSRDDILCDYCGLLRGRKIISFSVLTYLGPSQVD